MRAARGRALHVHGLRRSAFPLQGLESVAPVCMVKHACLGVISMAVVQENTLTLPFVTHTRHHHISDQY